MKSSSVAIDRTPKPRLARQRRHGDRELLEVQRAERRPEQQHAEHEREIADAVDDERLLARVGRRLLLVPEADQQVGAEADALPADEHDREVAPSTSTSMKEANRFRYEK